MAESSGQSRLARVVHRDGQEILTMNRLDILLWHVHGSWTTAFVQGPHRYLVPILPEADNGAAGGALANGPNR